MNLHFAGNLIRRPVYSKAYPQMPCAALGAPGFTLSDCSPLQCTPEVTCQKRKEERTFLGSPLRCMHESHQNGVFQLPRHTSETLPREHQTQAFICFIFFLQRLPLKSPCLKSMPKMPFNKRPFFSRSVPTLSGVLHASPVWF